jgi:hypothetical protein
LYQSKFHFVKQILGGIFVTIAMVGLGFNAEKGCKTIVKHKRNMFTFTGIFVAINIFFLEWYFTLHLCY